LRLKGTYARPQCIDDFRSGGVIEQFFEGRAAFEDANIDGQSPHR